MGAANLLLEHADFLAEKFDRTSALGANHVMVAAAVVLMLVAGDPVVEGDFAGQSAFGEKFQRAVNGGVADTRVFFLNKTMKLIGGEMIASLQKSTQNRVALPGLFQADALQMRMQNALGFADHLA